MKTLLLIFSRKLALINKEFVKEICTNCILFGKIKESFLCEKLLDTKKIRLGKVRRGSCGKGAFNGEI